ncbi:MAG: methyltransferase domain-containing protein [Bacteroidota bacterium]
MQLTGNISLNRFEWADKTAREVINKYFQETKPVHYDVGAGQNSLTKQLASETAIGYSFDLFPFDESVKQWDIEKIFPYNYQPADIVTFLEIVEHLNNPWICMKNLSAAMAPGGFLVLTTPNPGWSTSRTCLLFKGFLTCFTQSDLDANHHVFIAWPHILQKLLADNGLEIIEYVTLDGPTRLFSKGLKLSQFIIQFPARLIKIMIEKKDPSAMGMSYGIVARKIGGTT